MRKLSGKRILISLLGNLILGLGVATLRVSRMGNDPFGAAFMAYSEGLGIPLGHLQLAGNLCLLVVQLIFGRKYLGIGSVVNLALLGYIVQYALVLYGVILGADFVPSLPLQLLFMVAALLLITFGLSMYQSADAGVAPFDYLSMGMTQWLKTPYVVNRIATDMFCVVAILVGSAVGIVDLGNGYLGVATVICSLCLGPLINLFNRICKKWVSEPEANSAV